MVVDSAYLWLRPQQLGEPATLEITPASPSHPEPVYVRIRTESGAPVAEETVMEGTAKPVFTVELPADGAPWELYVAGDAAIRLPSVAEVGIGADRLFAAPGRPALETVTDRLTAAGCPGSAGTCAQVAPNVECGYVPDGCGDTTFCGDCPSGTHRCVDHQCVPGGDCGLLAGTSVFGKRAVFAVEAVAEEDVWFAGQSDVGPVLNRFTGAGCAAVDMSAEVAAQLTRLRAIDADPAGVWVAGDAGGAASSLSRLSNDSGEWTVHPLDGFASIADIHRAGDVLLIAASDRYLRRYDPQTATLETITLSSNDPLVPHGELKLQAIWGTADDLWAGGRVHVQGGHTANSAPGSWLHRIGELDERVDPSSPSGLVRNKSTIRAIDGAAIDDVWFVGDTVDGRPTALHWDGAELDEVALPDDETAEFNDVWLSPEGTVWAVGNPGIYRHDGAGWVLSEPSITYPVNWYGVSASRATRSSPASPSRSCCTSTEPTGAFGNHGDSDSSSSLVSRHEPPAAVCSP